MLEHQEKEENCTTAKEGRGAVVVYEVFTSHFGSSYSRRGYMIAHTDAIKPDGFGAASFRRSCTIAQTRSGMDAVSVRRLEHLVGRWMR